MTSEPTIGPLENFSRFDKVYDEDMATHSICREDCPRSISEKKGLLSTLCLCKELNKADRDAYLEEKADDARKYGEI